MVTVQRQKWRMQTLHEVYEVVVEAIEYPLPRSVGQSSAAAFAIQ